MLIVGDIAGIQDFIFDLPAEERGGQARILRARSFYVQILAEAVAFRIQRALGLARESLLFCAAGKFAIEARGAPDEVSEVIDGERAQLEEWLARETSGSLRISIAVHNGRIATETAARRYEAAMAELQRWKLRPWAPLAIDGDGRWRPEKLVLSPRRRDREYETFRRIGAALPVARHLYLMEDSDATLSSSGDLPSFGLPGFRASLSEERKSGTDFVLEADLSSEAQREGEPATRSVALTPQFSRPLARYIPTHPDGAPVWFEDLARMARGAPYLGILKMDADSLGVAIHDRLRSAADLRELARFSADLDDFFATELTRVLRGREWQATYTVYSGGDDLLLVGPWDRMLDLAAEIRSRFQRRFGASGLTLSGGLAIVRYRYPIRRGVSQAEDLLEQAKTIPAPRASSAKDQLAALGQLWKWEQHDLIVRAGKELARWVETGVARRGWLHRLLRLTLVRRGEIPAESRAEQLAATARLAYDVGRKYPAPNSHDAEARALRAWIDRILDQFDRYEATDDPDVLFLPAVIRYALLATRNEIPENDA